MTTRVPLCCSQTLRFCGSGMVMSPKPRTPLGASMSNERFSCIRMTTCSTSLMCRCGCSPESPARAGWPAGTSTWRSGPRSRRRRCAGSGACRHGPGLYRTSRISFLSRYWAGRGSGRATHSGLAGGCGVTGGLPGSALSSLSLPQAPATRSAAPRPGAGHGAGSEVHAFFILGTSGEQFEHRLAGQRQRLDLILGQRARDQKARSSKYMCRGPWCRRSTRRTCRCRPRSAPGRDRSCRRSARS